MCQDSWVPHRIHGTGIFAYKFTIKNPTIHVGIYTNPMDPMGTSKKRVEYD